MTETKDLILLMMVPVILIGLVVYIDESPTIIGAVTSADTKESNILGTYSINPSFKAKIEYDLDDYSKIRDSLNIISNCAQNKDVQSCVNEINTNDNSFTWSLGCDKGAEKVLYDFAEFMQNCIDSEDNGCLCTKDMEIKKEDIQGYGVKGNQYSFLIEEYPSLRQITISSESGDLSYTINNNGKFGLLPKRYSLGYSLGRTPEFNLFFYDLTGNEIKPGFGPTTQIIIYKNNINNLNSFDFVNQEGENLAYPNGKVVNDKMNNPINPNNMPKCNFKQTSIYRFCATKKDYKIMAYDKIDDQIKERSVTIRFAAYIPPKQQQ